MEHIGSGASGVVWRAVDERLERAVAVKKIQTQPGLAPSEHDMVRQRAMREAKNAARFQHPNAIVVFDIAEDDGDLCLVMEYLPSRSLSAVLALDGVLTPAQAAYVGEQAAAALAAAHEAGIVHRDVKPGNILIDDHGVAKITDFGISRAIGDHTLTETGMICGTPAYLAPEVARGAEPTAASDVFALGATLYHALEGQPPYGTNTNQLALLYTAASGQMSPPKQAGPMTALLESLLRVEPHERPTMSQACEQLAALVQSMPATTLTSKHWQTPVLPLNAHPATLATNGVGFGSAKANGVVAGVVGIVALVAIAVVLLVLDLAGSRSPTSGHQPLANVLPPVTATTTPQATAAPATPQVETSTVTVTVTPAPAAIGAPPSAGAPVQVRTSSDTQVEWGPAGAVVEQFYGNPAGSWILLDASAQAAYGSQDNFQQYWAAHQIAGYSGIHNDAGQNNPDGSVNMRLDSLSYTDGTSKSKVLRVVDVNGRLLIDSDTR